MDGGREHATRNGGVGLLALVLAIGIGWDVYRAEGDPPDEAPAITQSSTTTPAQTTADMDSPAPVGLEPDVSP
jgi:hypothetical protein